MTEITIDPERYADITLDVGYHQSREQGTCLMEAVAYLAGEQHRDNPMCVSPVLADFGRVLNDGMSHELRQELKGLIPSLPGTANDGFDQARFFMCADWISRIWLPSVLEMEERTSGIAQELRSMPRITNLALVASAQCLVEAAGCLIGGPVSIMDNLQRRTGRPARPAYAALCGHHGAKLPTLGQDSLMVAECVSFECSSALDELQLSAIDLFVEMIKNPR